MSSLTNSFLKPLNAAQEGIAGIERQAHKGLVVTTKVAATRESDMNNSALFVRGWVRLGGISQESTPGYKLEDEQPQRADSNRT